MEQVTRIVKYKERTKLYNESDLPVINHLGKPCPHTDKTIICPEGYCSECNVYHGWCLSLWY